jgi:hypothetical protein
VSGPGCTALRVSGCASGRGRSDRGRSLYTASRPRSGRYRRNAPRDCSTSVAGTRSDVPGPGVDWRPGPPVVPAAPADTSGALRFLGTPRTQTTESRRALTLRWNNGAEGGVARRRVAAARASRTTEKCERIGSHAFTFLCCPADSLATGLRPASRATGDDSLRASATRWSKVSAVSANSTSSVCRNGARLLGRLISSSSGMMVMTGFPAGRP